MVQNPNHNPSTNSLPRVDSLNEDYLIQDHKVKLSRGVDNEMVD